VGIFFLCIENPNTHPPWNPPGQR